jgi:nucleoside-diphosphate-sugar epimerase
VTGVKGMIGSRLVGELLKAGHHVIGIDRTGKEVCGKNYARYQADLGDKERIKMIVDTNKVDRFIHLAALAHTEGESDLSWDRYYHVNVKCAKNLFDAAGEKPVLFISTIDVYGFFDGKSIVDGQTELHPVSNYGKSKALAEKACRKLKHYTIFRFSPIYSDEIKRDIQKRYYLKYPNVAYQVGRGTEYEILNVKKAIKSIVAWCNTEPINDIRVIKDSKSMWTPDYIKAERKAGRAKLVLHFPRWIVCCGYVVLKRVFGENEKTYLLNKVVYPLKSK